MFAADSNLPELEVTIGGSSHYAQKETARVRLVSGDYFDTLEIRPAAGKLLLRKWIARVALLQSR